MSQQEMICRNKEEAELKLEVKIVATFHNFFHDIIEKNRMINVATKKENAAT